MELTIALNRYDRHVPIFNGSVKPPKGTTIRALEVGESHDLAHGGSRHARMLKSQEFDVAEMSLASWIAAVANTSELPLVGIPTFPRRFFSVGQIYVPTASAPRSRPISSAARSGCIRSRRPFRCLPRATSSANTASPGRTSTGSACARKSSDVDLGNDVRIEWLTPGKDIGEMLMAGEIDALMSPEPRKSMLARPDGYRRLFRDSCAEELRYFRKYGFFPVMHLMVARRELIERQPELALDLMAMFEEAKRIAYQYYDDSDYSLIVWSRNAYEEQRRTARRGRLEERIQGQPEESRTIPGGRA